MRRSQPPCSTDEVVRKFHAEKLPESFGVHFLQTHEIRIVSANVCEDLFLSIIPVQGLYRAVSIHLSSACLIGEDVERIDFESFLVGIGLAFL